MDITDEAVWAMLTAPIVVKGAKGTTKLHMSPTKIQSVADVT